MSDNLLITVAGSDNLRQAEIYHATGDFIYIVFYEQKDGLEILHPILSAIYLDFTKIDDYQELGEDFVDYLYDPREPNDPQNKKVLHSWK